MVSVGVTPTSSCPNCNENSGTINGTRITNDATTATHGCRATPRAQASHRRSPTLRGFGRRNAGTFTRRTQSPSNDRIAGSSVIEASTAMNTAIAEANPSEVTNGIPATASEASAITTVLPAKTIALPEEATAFAIDASTSMPSPS